MAYPSDPELLVLVALRLRSLAETPAIVASSGLAAPEVDSVLSDLAAAGLAQHRDGRLTGWMLTATGRTDVAARLPAELAATDTSTAAAVGDAYSAFLSLNQQVLDVCTRWQLRTVQAETVANDHTDVDHDDLVIADLAGLDERAQRVCAQLARCLDRFAGYGPRLGAALAAVVGGEHRWLTDPAIDSYHSVWFELHENLLATLGIERGRERPVSSNPLQEAR